MHITDITLDRHIVGNPFRNDFFQVVNDKNTDSQSEFTEYLKQQMTKLQLELIKNRTVLCIAVDANMLLL